MINRSCVCQGLLALTNNSWSDDGINKVEGCHGHGAAILFISLIEFIVWHKLMQVTFRGVWSVWYMLKSWNLLVYKYARGKFLILAVISEMNLCTGGLRILARYDAILPHLGILTCNSAKGRHQNLTEITSLNAQKLQIFAIFASYLASIVTVYLR